MGEKDAAGTEGGSNWLMAHEGKTREHWKLLAYKGHQGTVRKGVFSKYTSAKITQLNLRCDYIQVTLKRCLQINGAQRVTRQLPSVVSRHRVYYCIVFWR